MEQDTNAIEMLDLLVQAAFCVKDGVIVRVNHAAQQQQIQTGIPIDDLIFSGAEEYAALTSGCLYLTLTLYNCNLGASVTRQSGYDVFILQDDTNQSELQAMALAAQELRTPLSNVMTVADQLFPLADESNQTIQDQIAQINRGLFRLQRILGNMSDAATYASGSNTHFEVVEITASMDEIFSNAASLIEHSGISLHFKNLNESLYCQADIRMLERAILNILSNSVRFTPKGGSIIAKLIRKGNKLYLTISDSGEGVPNQLRGSVFSRYLRQPTIEDGRFGIGLGMVLVRSAAAAHDGTVLLEQPENSGCRVTLSMTIHQRTAGTLHSRVQQVDYAGGRNHSLIELSDCLPTELYHREDIN